jgi:hypothetical protein
VRFFKGNLAELRYASVHKIKESIEQNELIIDPDISIYGDKLAEFKLQGISPHDIKNILNSKTITGDFRHLSFGWSGSLKYAYLRMHNMERKSSLRVYRATKCEFLKIIAKKLEVSPDEVSLE